ncbi:MAG: hypothetical protein [Caudoviricetes sp.]|nr:MAG: hypothetical protein [Caudoviricetes sp.]
MNILFNFVKPETEITTMILACHHERLDQVIDFVTAAKKDHLIISVSSDKEEETHVTVNSRPFSDLSESNVRDIINELNAELIENS